MQISMTFEMTPKNAKTVIAFITEMAGEISTMKTDEPKKETKKAKKEAEPVKQETGIVPGDPEAPKAQIIPAEPEEPKAEAITKTDLRALALKLSRSGKSDQLAEILKKFGAACLSDVKESDYADLMRELVSANA